MEANTKSCIVCGKEFEAKRKDAQFCSANCRKTANRGSVPATTVEPTSKEPSMAKALDGASGPKEEKKPYDKEAAIRAFRKMGLDSVEWITTGIPEFDALTMIPKGRITQIQGPYAVGKTTLALNMVKGLTDKRVLYIDSEAALSPEILGELGVNPDLFTLYNKSAFIEDIYDVIIKASQSGDYDLIIFDSLAACTFRNEAAGASTDANIGQKAKVVGKLMRIVPMYLKASKTALVIINQEREVIGGYVPVKYTPGGQGVLYAASLMVSLKTIKSWRFPKDPKDGVYKGHAVEATIIKSRVNTPWRKTMFNLTYPEMPEVMNAFSPDTAQMVDEALLDG